VNLRFAVETLMISTILSEIRILPVRVAILLFPFISRQWRHCLWTCHIWFSKVCS